MRLMDMEAEAKSVPDAKKWWFDPVTAVLMAVASLSTAWCSYQSSLWSGQNSALDTHADKLERQISMQHLEAKQIEAMQMRMWMESVDATIDGDKPLAKFYSDRFEDELRPAYDKWIALNPFEDPTAPPHPFVPALYAPRFEQEIRDARVQSHQMQAQSNLTSHYASTYLSNTVILASVLFFAGTAGQFDHRRVRWFSLAFATAMFSYAMVRMVLLPVA